MSGARILAGFSAGQGRAVRVWSAFWLLIILVSVPVFSTVLPPLFDYPNHLARMHLLEEGGNQFYAVRWAALPNLAEDLIVPLLGRLIPLALAAKLFLVMIFALMAGGAVWLNRVVSGIWRLWPLLAFLLLYSRTFLWGFGNYLFGLGVAVCATALWLALEGRRAWLRVFASSLMALACFFSHLAIFGCYALVIVGVEAAPAVAELRTRQWSAFARRLALAGSQFIVPAVLILGFSPRGGGGGISYAGFWRKADLLFGVFDNYDRAFDIAGFALFLGLFGVLAGTRRLRLDPRLGAAIGIVFAAYLIFPSQLLSGSGADHRLPVALFLLLVAASVPRFASRRWGMAVGAGAALLLLVRLSAIEQVWRRADQVYAADLAGIDALPRGAKLAVAFPADAIHFVAVPEVHLATLAILRRDAFVPTLFAFPAQQPVALEPAWAALAEGAPPQLLWDALVEADAAARARVSPALEQYGYVAVTDRRPVHVPSNPCLDPVLRQPTFQIFALVHNSACASPDP